MASLHDYIDILNYLFLQFLDHSLIITHDNHSGSSSSFDKIVKIIKIKNNVTTTINKIIIKTVHYITLLQECFIYTALM